MDESVRKMVKIFFILSVLVTFAFSSVYGENCVKCHKEISLSLEKLFYEYLLKYSSEIETKYAIKEYLLNPNREDSILTDEDFKRYGIKKKSSLPPKDLEKAIDEYWDIYKVFGKLK